MPKTKKEMKTEEGTVGSAALIGAALGGASGGWGGAVVGFLLGAAIDNQAKKQKEHQIRGRDF